MHTKFGSFFANKLKKHDLYGEFCEYENNAWFAYLLGKQNESELRGDTWIDFEHEIRIVISDLEQIDFKENWPGAFFAERKCYHSLADKFHKDKGNDWATYEKHGIAISEFLFEELQKFTRAFEIYCICLVNSCIEDYAEMHNLSDISSEMFSLNKDIFTELYRNKESARRAHDDGLKKHFTPQTKYTEQALMQVYEMDKKLRECCHYKKLTRCDKIWQ